MTSYYGVNIRPFVFTVTARMMAVMKWFLIPCFIMALPFAHADTLRVAVASNFADTLRALAGTFEQQTGHTLQVLPGSTGKHYAQIRNGAPFDIFLAADVRRPALLEKAGVGVPATRFTYALGQLVLWSASPNKVDARGDVLLQSDFKRLAIANPALAPYGRAARDVLEARGLWVSLQAKIVRGENIAQTFQFIQTGNAELGFVAWSQLLRHDGTAEGSWWSIPQSLYRPIEQQALQIKDTPAARAFMNFLQSPEARADIKAHGYGLP